MEQRPDALRQCPQEIVQCRHQRQPGDPAVHRPVVVKEPAQQRQQDQGDRQRVQEHQHRHSVGDNGGKPHVGKQERSAAEHQHPLPVGQRFGEHPLKGFRAAGHQADGGL
mgnify:CR=1 FL=1